MVVCPVCQWYVQEQYINDKDFLLSCAESAGLPRDQAAAVLDNPSGKGEQLVQQELGKYAGITGVPHFVINGRCVCDWAGQWVME
jgi:predicted DsbA family dithiol-disulfide isomerase